MRSFVASSLLAFLLLGQGDALADNRAPLPKFSTGFTTGVPAGVPKADGAWFAGSPLQWQLGNGTTSACTAHGSPALEQSPFCPAGVSPGGMCPPTKPGRYNSGLQTVQFPVTVGGNVGTGNFTFCAGGNVDYDSGTNHGAIIFGGTNDTNTNGASATGWEFWAFNANFFGNGPLRGRVSVADGTHIATASGSVSAFSGWHLFCFTFTHNSSSGLQVYFDGAASGSAVSTTSIGSMTTTNGISISQPPNLQTSPFGYGALQGAWYFDAALSSGTMARMYTAWAANGMGVPQLLDDSNGGVTARMTWLASNVFANLSDPGTNPTVYSGQSTRITTPDPEAAPPMCGSTQATTGPCLASQWFQGDSQQYFDCGVVADPGPASGSPTSPTNDFSLCAVYSAYSQTTAAIVYRATGSNSWQLTKVAYNGSGNARDYAMLIVTPGSAGTPAGADGPQSTGVGAWTVGCFTVQAVSSRLVDCPTGTATCGYQNGVLYNATSIAHATSPACDCLNPAPNFHGSGHLIIGSDALADSNDMTGEIVGVWWWNSLLSDAQMAAFAAPWQRPGVTSTLGAAAQSVLINGQCINFSAGL